MRNGARDGNKRNYSAKVRLERSHVIRACCQSLNAATVCLKDCP